MARETEFDTLSLGSAHSKEGAISRTFLLVFDAAGSRIVDLPECGELTIGRAAAADLRIDDDAASRAHARLWITRDGARVEDLNSRHGTRVNDQRIDGSREIRAQDVIAIGAASVVFLRESSGAPRRALLDPLRFRQRLEEEVDRCVRYQKSSGLLCIALKRSDDSASVRLALDGQLRLVDVVGWGPANELLVLVPECEYGELTAKGSRLADLLGGADAPGAGCARCPEDGCDADTLLAGARAAAQSARSGETRIASELATRIDLGGIEVLIADPVMARTYELIEKLGKTDLSVLILGETGSGKELVARALHHFSSRRDAPWVALNCASLHDTLVESELFGHEKGAFSGADKSKLGLLEAADGGTLFLDEVGELSASTQAKLLRVLETGALRRLGDVRERSVDVRVVAATHRDLRAGVEAGTFREDLLFRLCVGKIALPPLRQRRRELPMLAREFTAKACAGLGRECVHLTTSALQALQAYSWPGNVRELKNAIEYAVATAEGDSLESWNLPDDVVGFDEGAVVRAEASRAADGSNRLDNARGFRRIDEEVRELERTRMREALDATGGVQTRAAELIGMPLRTFVTKLKVYGLREVPRAGRERRQ